MQAYHKYKKILLKICLQLQKRLFSNYEIFVKYSITIENEFKIKNINTKDIFCKKQ